MKLADFQFGLHVDFEIDVGANPILLRLSVLADQNKDRQKNGFQRNDHGQQAKRIRIESRHADIERIDDDPYAKPQQIQAEKWHAAAEPGNPVRHTLNRSYRVFDFFVDVARYARAEQVIGFAGDAAER